MLSPVEQFMVSSLQECRVVESNAAQGNHISGLFLRTLLTNAIKTSDDPTIAISVGTTLHLRGYFIDGPLDLALSGSANSPLPHLLFENCTFSAGINIISAVLGQLSFKYCDICSNPDDQIASSPSALRANSATIGGSVELQDCFLSAGSGLDFSCANISHGFNILRLTASHRDHLIKFGSVTSRDSNGATDQRISPVDNGRSPRLGRILLSSATIGGDLTLSGLRLYLQTNDERGVLRADSATIKGDVVLLGTKTQPCELHGECRFPAARIGGQLVFKGVSLLSEKGPPALLAEGAHINGDLFIRAEGDADERVDSVIRGQIDLMDAFIGGQFQIAGNVTVDTSACAIKAVGMTVGRDLLLKKVEGSICFIKGNVDLSRSVIGGRVLLSGLSIEGKDLALAVDGASIGGDVTVQPHMEDNIISESCFISGDLTFTGTTIGGNFNVADNVKANTRFADPASNINASKASPGVEEALYACTFRGQLNLSRVVVKGRVTLTSCQLGRDKSSVALLGDGLVLGEDFNITRTVLLPCRIAGKIRLVGATISGRLIFNGVVCESALGNPAIVANGAKIRGGMFCERWHYGDEARDCEIKGEVRLQNAKIDGPLELRGVRIKSYKGDGVALLATNATFGGNVHIMHDAGVISQIDGEVRLWGANIAGSLRIEGAALRAGSNGYALDCYTAEIAKGVSIRQAAAISKKGGDTNQIDTTLEGVVAFAHSRMTYLNIGLEEPEEHTTSSVSICGYLRLDQITVRARTSIDRLLLSPIFDLDKKLYSQVGKLMRRRHISDPRTILSAPHSNLGTELYIRLAAGSAGLVDLYAAKVGSLDDDGGAGWGEGPVGAGWLVAADSMWDKPNGPVKMQGVRLILNGFTYDRIHGSGERDEKRGRNDQVITPWTTKVLRGSPQRLAVHRRIAWLGRQCANAQYSIDTFVPHPFRQLARAYRNQGDILDANDVVRVRRWKQVDYVRDNIAHKVIEYLFGVFFGFGYSPARAVITLLVLLALNFSFVISLSGFHHRVVDGVNLYPQRGGDQCLTPQWIQAFDLLLPVIHLGTEKGCEVQSFAPFMWHFARALLLFLSWLAVPTAALTVTGFFKETNG